MNVAADITKEYKFVHRIALDQRIDLGVLKSIRDKGYSRMPIYHQIENFVVAILIVKSLVGIDVPDQDADELDKPRLCDLIAQRKVVVKDPIIVGPDAQVGTLMKYFREGYVHQAIVCENS